MAPLLYLTVPDHYRLIYLTVQGDQVVIDVGTETFCPYMGARTGWVCAVWVPHPADTDTIGLLDAVRNLRCPHAILADRIEEVYGTVYDLPRMLREGVER